jgi:methylation protein EvaC
MKYCKCRITGEKIPVVFSYGDMPIANYFSKKINKKNNYKMKIAFNEKNGVFQLVSAPKPKRLFNKNYAFMSSTSKNMQKHFRQVAEIIKKRFLKNKFRIMEIGCNDGIFLQNFKKFNHLGVEPSKNVCQISKSKKLNVVNSFFNKQLIEKNKLKNKFDIIFAANVICHIPDITSLFRNIELTLKDEGVFIFEEPYLGDVIEKTSYDQIYDEHFYLFSVNAIKSIIRNLNLEVLNAERISTHGGSVRYYIQKKGARKISNKLTKILNYEKKIQITKVRTIRNFAKKCIESKKKILQTIEKLNKKKIKIYGYGATSKSTTIINFCNLKSNSIEGIFDTSPTKIGRYAPGTSIPIIDYKKFDIIKPKYCILFAWNHYLEIFKKEKNKNIIWITHINKKFFNKKNSKNIIAPSL